MPTGIPKSGKRKPKGAGARSKPGTPSSQTQRLMEAMQEIEERLAIERRKDKARGMLVSFAQKYDLTAADLREAAKLLGTRETGAAPVFTANIGRAKKLAIGRKLKEAREAKGLQSNQLGKLVGAKGTAAVAQWERGMMPMVQKYRDGLIKALDLPKDFFAEMGAAKNAPRRTNGAHP